MAIDASIPLAGRFPDFGKTFRNALITGQQFREAYDTKDVRKQLMEQRTQIQEQALSNNAEDRKRMEVLGTLKALRQMDPAKRDLLAPSLENSLKQRGFMGEDDSFLDDPYQDDAWLDASITALEGANRKAIGVDQQNFEARMKAAGIEPGSEEYKRAARIQARLEPGEVGASDKVVLIGGVPHRFNPNTGKMHKVDIAGDEVTPEVVATSEETISKGRAKGAALGKAEGEALSALPQTIDNADYMISTLEKAINHPGLEVATGLSSKMDPRNFTPGTEAFDFNVIRDQIQGQTFLQAYQSLKGGGQITEIEGKKAEQAIARMNTAQSTEAWVEAANEFIEVIRAGSDRARAKAGQQDAKRRQAIESQGGDPSLFDFMTPEERALFDEPND